MTLRQYIDINSGGPGSGKKPGDCGPDGCVDKQQQQSSFVTHELSHETAIGGTPPGHRNYATKAAKYWKMRHEGAKRDFPKEDWGHYKQLADHYTKKSGL